MMDSATEAIPQTFEFVANESIASSIIDSRAPNISVNPETVSSPLSEEFSEIESIQDDISFEDPFQKSEVELPLALDNCILKPIILQYYLLQLI
jgi:hypothetical protein